MWKIESSMCFANDLIKLCMVLFNQLGYSKETKINGNIVVISWSKFSKFEYQQVANQPSRLGHVVRSMKKNWLKLY